MSGNKLAHSTWDAFGSNSYYLISPGFLREVTVMLFSSVVYEAQWPRQERELLEAIAVIERQMQCRQRGF